MMEATRIPILVAVATTTQAVDTASTTGLCYKMAWDICSQEKFYYSGKSGTQASGGQQYSTTYNYNQGTSSTKNK